MQSLEKNGINSLCKASSCNTAFTQKLVFSELDVRANQEILILAERTLLLFPLLRKCEKRYKKALNHTRKFQVNKKVSKTSLANNFVVFKFFALNQAGEFCAHKQVSSKQKLSNSWIAQNWDRKSLTKYFAENLCRITLSKLCLSKTSFFK